MTIGQVSIIRHPRARRMRLRLDGVSGQASLIAPPRVSLAQINAFIAEHQNWLQKQRERVLTPIVFEPLTELILLGKITVLTHNPSYKGAALWQEGRLTLGGAPEQFAKRVERALRQLALTNFTAQANELAAQLGLPPCPVRVKDTRSRWGSCSPRTGINLSWRLIFAPPEVARYVIAHEVAHRRELNHGNGFWNLVEQLVGKHSHQREWLAVHGRSLFRYSGAKTVASLPPDAA